MIENDAELLEERLAVLGIGDELKFMGNGVELGGEIAEFGWGVAHSASWKSWRWLFSARERFFGHKGIT